MFSSTCEEPSRCTSRQPLTASQSSSASQTLMYTGGGAPGAKTHIANCSRSSCTQHNKAACICGDQTEWKANVERIPGKYTLHRNCTHFRKQGDTRENDHTGSLGARNRQIQQLESLPFRPFGKTFTPFLSNHKTTSPNATDLTTPPLPSRTVCQPNSIEL